MYPIHSQFLPNKFQAVDLGVIAVGLTLSAIGIIAILAQSNMLPNGLGHTSLFSLGKGGGSIFTIGGFVLAAINGYFCFRDRKWKEKTEEHQSPQKDLLEPQQAQIENDTQAVITTPPIEEKAPEDTALDEEKVPVDPSDEESSDVDVKIEEKQIFSILEQEKHMHLSEETKGKWKEFTNKQLCVFSIGDTFCEKLEEVSAEHFPIDQVEEIQTFANTLLFTDAIFIYGQFSQEDRLLLSDDTLAIYGIDQKTQQTYLYMQALPSFLKNITSFENAFIVHQNPRSLAIYKRN